MFNKFKVKSEPEKVVEYTVPRQLYIEWADVSGKHRLELIGGDEAVLSSYDSGAAMFSTYHTYNVNIPLDVMRRFLDEVAKVE